MSWLRMVLSDFVIVRSLDLDLEQGFTVLTGETGAGKSILIDALQLVLGGRADAGVVREGASRCEIAAEFTATPAVQQCLQAQGFDMADESHPTVLLKRSIDTQGRSRSWINGSTATVGQLKEVAEHLVDIHGQHAWQSLTRSDSVRELLDRYAQLDTTVLRQHWHVWRQAQQALEHARTQQVQQQQEQERLQWQIAEMGKLQPQANEWAELNQQHKRLAHAQGLIDAAQQALQGLDASEPSACALVHRAIQALQTQQHIEPRYGELAHTLGSALAQLEDACHDLQHHLHHTEVDPAALEQLDQRLGLWLALARRHRCPPETLPQLWAQWQQQLHDLEHSSDLDALQQAERHAYRQWHATAQRISEQRSIAAQQVSLAITQAMQSLGMAGGSFQAQLLPLDVPQAHGLEQVEFLVAGHPGASLRPVSKVASGGELSRIALAIAVCTSQLGPTPTLVFDEVDSGIGGTVAHTVGQLMRQLGQDRQVLAVTHLPQVAACAHQHLRVSKAAHEGRTISQVQALQNEERVHELARMLAGEHVSPTSLAHAREMMLP